MIKTLKVSIKAWCLILILHFTVTTAVSSNENKTFTIGWDIWMPYQHIDQNGRLTGLDVELIQAIFNKMGCQLEYREVPWKQLLPAIKRGQISLAAGASKSKQRMTYAYFSNAYRTESVVLFFRKGEKYPIKKISDIIKTDLTIGIIKGNYYGKTFEKLMKNKDFNRHVQFVNNDTINIKKTLNSRIDGFLIDKFAGISAINKYGAYNLFQIHPIPISSEDIHVMFSKKACQPIDVKRFNEALDILKKNGVLNSIIHKYFQ